jgi:hypothetical protein
VFVVLWRFYVPSPSAVRLAQIYAQRLRAPEAQNAYIYLWGLPAPPATDALELGRKRIVWLQQRVVNPNDFSPDPLGESEEVDTLRSNGMRALNKACGPGPDTPCAAAIDAWPADLAFNERESAGLQRYRAMLALGRWFEVVPYIGDGPLPPFAQAFDGQRLQMLELRQAAVAGDAARVRETLQADLAFWREVLKSSDILISKMIACSAIRNHFFLGNVILRRMPPAKQAEAIPPLWRQSLSTEEKSLFRAMAGEFEYSRGRVEWLRGADAGFEEFDEEYDDDYQEDLVDEWLGRIGHRVRPWQRQLNRLADVYLGLAETFAVPLDKYQRAEMNFAERFTDNPAGNRITTYAMRVGSVEGMRRAALLTAELRSRAVPESSVSSEVTAASLKNPFTLAPFEWDAERRAVIYEGPENHKWRRNVYFY